MKWFAILPLTSLSLASCSLGITGAAEDAVKAKLTDPSSAQFRNVMRCQADKNVVRGEVNSKNRLGGYVGFKSFYYSPSAVVFEEDADFSQMINKCYGPSSSRKGEDATLDQLKQATASLERARKEAADEAAALMGEGGDGK